MKKTLSIIIILLTISNISEAKWYYPFDGDPIVDAGTVLQLAIPASGLIYSMAISDWEGTVQWLKANGSTLIATQGLKFMVNDTRPDKSDKNSFPSGHTSSAFAGATFWHMRYGLSIGIPMYALATFTGYSRLYGNKHHLRDVLFGAFLGIGFNILFTSEYIPKNMILNFKPLPSGGMIEFTMAF